jgi:hypothetical protein
LSATGAAESSVKAKIGFPTDFSATAAQLACPDVTLADASILCKLKALHPVGTCPHLPRALRAIYLAEDARRGDHRPTSAGQTGEYRFTGEPCIWGG